MDIDTVMLQAELQEFTGKEHVKVKLDKHLAVASSIRQDDKGYLIRLNPNKFRSPKKLEAHLNMCREAVVK